jgi:hypothetical protein
VTCGLDGGGRGSGIAEAFGVSIGSGAEGLGQVTPGSTKYKDGSQNSIPFWEFSDSSGLSFAMIVEAYELEKQGNGRTSNSRSNWGHDIVFKRGRLEGGRRRCLKAESGFVVVGKLTKGDGCVWTAGCVALNRGRSSEMQQRSHRRRTSARRMCGPSLSIATGGYPHRLLHNVMVMSIGWLLNRTSPDHLLVYGADRRWSHI